MTGAPTAEAVLNVARGELGTLENPLGSNNVVYNSWYYGRRVSGGSYPWCATFLSYVADRAGALAAGIIPRHAYTPSGAGWFQARGRWGTTPRVGALVYYNFGGLGRISHCGIVEAVHADGTWTAIEGNTDVAGGRTGGRVMRQRRSRLGEGGGFGYPAYTEAPQATRVGPVEITRATQRAVNMPAAQIDGVWGPVTDGRVNLVRLAALGTFLPDAVNDVQVCIGTPADGVWGPASAAALADTVEVLQRTWGATVDGEWGPNTEARWQACRAACYRP